MRARAPWFARALRVMGRRLGLSDGPAWRVFAGYFRPHARALALYALLSSLQSLSVLPVLYLVRYAFDVAIPETDIWLLVYLGVAIVALRAASSALVLVMRSFVLGIIKRSVRDLRHDLIARIYAMSRDFHVRADPGRVHSWIVQETERVDHLSNALFSAILPAALTSIALALCLVLLSWQMVLLMMVVGPLVWIATGITNRLVNRHVKAFQSSFETFSRNVFFVLRHIDLTAIQAYEREETRRQARNLDRVSETGRTMAMSFALHRQVQQNIVGLAGILCLVVGGAQVALGEITLGDFLIFYLAASLLNGSVSTVIGAIPDVVAGNASLSKLRELIESGQPLPYRGTREIAFTGQVTLEHVSFAYGDRPLLIDVNLEIRPGARIAIIGPNGAGKSTIFNLIIGFYRPATGRVLADGLPYDEIEMRGLRRQMGVVVQRATFFTGTIWENLTYGWPEAGRDEVIVAATLAGAHEFISGLDNGYETEVGEGGLMLSGGQCQRIAIARALLGRPRLLILDEPTNHLDAAAVEAFMKTLLEHADRPAVVMISHDAQIVGFADEVYRLDGGVLARQANVAGRTAVATA